MTARYLGIEFPRGWVVVLIMMSTLLWFAGSFYERLWGTKCGALTLPDMVTSRSVRNASNASAGSSNIGGDVSSTFEMATFCFQGQCWLPGNDGTQEFPNFFLGIGPGRSGSTKITAELKEHPSVVVGDAKLGKQACCYHELYVLTERERFLQGQSVYVKFFPPEMNGSAIRRTRWFGEKTPLYSTNRLVPFRAMAMFGPRLKLFLTWREPAEMFVSRYLQLSRKLKETKRNETFAQWTGGIITNYKKFSSCRQEHLTRLSLTERVIYSDSNFSIPATGSLEEHLDELCEQETNGPLAALEGLGMFRRWAYVFGKHQILCILLEDQSSRMDWILDRVAKHLGIDRAGFSSDRIKRFHHHSSPNASFDKLQQHQIQFGSEVVEEGWSKISEIRALAREESTLEDQRLFSQLCQ